MVKTSTCQCRKQRRCKFNPWVGKIPWRRRWQYSLSILTGKSLWTEEPCGLQSIGSQRVGHNSATEHTSTVHEILQERILEWVAILFSRGSSQPRDQTKVSCIAGGFFTVWAIREAHCSIYCWKKKKYKWIFTVQTHIVQGSTVHLFILYFH